jgi:hypothetical protein
MKNLIKTTATFLFLAIAMSFYSCDKDLYEEQIIKSRKSMISFEEFKTQTGIKNVTNIKNVSVINDNARSIDQDYYINTDEILKYISENNKTTYTFKIFPINEELQQREYYNLVYEKINNEWNEIIFKKKERRN